jgi:glycyl-tRNA synthetase beta chain
MNFLLELGSEEIPARMQAAAAEQLARRFGDALKAAGLAHGAVTADATPRRLWLRAEDVAAASAASGEERKGPAATAPEAAIAGFLRSTGLTRDQLEERETPKGVVLFAHIKRDGRSAADILAEVIPALVRDFDWPKSMRWGAASATAGSPRWVRPLTGIVALLGDTVVDCSVHGITAGRETRGHRIHAPGLLRIDSADSHTAQLLAAKVIVASAERRAIIEARAAEVAAARGLTVIPDAGLVAENAGLTEWPVPMLGSFDPAFLAVPREVIQLTMRTNQKYFACTDAAGALAPNFVCVANLEASDGGVAIVAGNERVLSARLSDAKFFWDQDVAAVKAGGLEVFLPKLGDIVFHEKLGTVADKVERVAKLARWLVESGAITSPRRGEVERHAQRGPGEGLALSASAPSPGSAAPSPTSPQRGEVSLAALAEQAARLCKADLVSATVGEFPEVQGLAGAYLARVAGLDPQVADAIRDHYKPVGQGDDVPTAPVSVAVALADKLDTLGRFFAEELYPTSSKDPFALRRAALGVLRLVIAADLSLDVFEVVQIGLFGQVLDLEHRTESMVWRRVYSLDGFFKERLEQMLREDGVSPGIVRAVLEEGNIGFRPKRAVAAARSLQAFVATDDGANLLAGYKRAANILKIEAKKDEPAAASRAGRGEVHPAEAALAAALDAALPAAAAAVAAEEFGAAMTALAGLRAPVDRFFADVMVNDPDPAVRADRLALLGRFRDAVHAVADFSKVEG